MLQHNPEFVDNVLLEWMVSLKLYQFRFELNIAKQLIPLVLKCHQRSLQEIQNINSTYPELPVLHHYETFMALKNLVEHDPRLRISPMATIARANQILAAGYFQTMEETALIRENLLQYDEAITIRDIVQEIMSLHGIDTFNVHDIHNVYDNAVQYCVEYLKKLPKQSFGCGVNLR